MVEKIAEDEIRKDIQQILADEIPEEAEAKLGENRGQLFVRIPKIVTQRLSLDKDSRIIFKVKNKNKKPYVEIEVKHGKA